MIFQVYIKRKFTPELSTTKLAPVFRRIMNFSAMGHHDSPEITLTLEKKIIKFVTKITNSLQNNLPHMSHSNLFLFVPGAGFGLGFLLLGTAFVAV